MVELTVARPGVVIGKGGAGIEELQKHLAKLTNSDVKINKVFEVKRPEIQAALIAETVAQQCERRANPKRAAQKAAEAAMATGQIKGVEIWVAGRIKGAEIARTERVLLGTVPRHSLRADIDYAHAEGQVPSAGIHGVKVWVNKGEKHDYEINQ
jgi:small subunit ribosomal protein S3